MCVVQRNTLLRGAACESVTGPSHRHRENRASSKSGRPRKNWNCGKSSYLPKSKYSMFAQSVLCGRIYSISAKTGVDISYVTVKIDGTCIGAAGARDIGST